MLFISFSISFSYGDKENDCGSEFAKVIDTHILDPDEYIIRVTGRATFNINKVSQGLVCLIRSIFFIIHHELALWGYTEQDIYCLASYLGTFLTLFNNNCSLSPTLVHFCLLNKEVEVTT